MTVVLAGGHGVSMMTLVGRPPNDPSSGEQERVRRSMKRLKVKLFLGVVAGVLTTAVAQAQAAPWTVVNSPSPGTGNGLFGAASISANGGWAMGDSSTSGIEQTLTEFNP